MKTFALIIALVLAATPSFARGGGHGGGGGHGAMGHGGFHAGGIQTGRSVGFHGGARGYSRPFPSGGAYGYGYNGCNYDYNGYYVCNGYFPW